MALSVPLFFATSIFLLSFLVIASATDSGSAPTSKVDEKYPKSPEVDEKYLKVPKVDEKYLKVSKDNEKYPKAPKVDGKYLKAPKVGEKYPKMPKVDEKYPKVPKVDEKYPKLLNFNAKSPKVEKFPKLSNGFKQVVAEDVYSKLVPKTIGIQGTVLCKSGLTSFPIKGAVIRITCLSEDEYGYETAPFSVLSGASDANGYFFATLSPSQLKDKFKLTKCEAFLDHSPLESCEVPCDVNQGVSGHTLSSYRNLNAKIKLYSVGPFFYTSAPTAPAAPKPVVPNKKGY